VKNGPERRAAILIGPEYGTIGRQDLVAAAREAVDARFDVLIACAFNFDAHSSELGNLGSLKILKARINPDMHMSDELKNTGRGNMFVVFGEPDVEILTEGGPEIRVKVNGVDVFDPNTGDIRSSDMEGIAAWFIDTDYDEESFFVRHAYFLGANNPYDSLRTALQAEVDEDAWATLYSDTSRPFERPESGSHRGEGHQPLRRRGYEGFQRVMTADLQVLAEFLPALRQPGFKAGEICGGDEIEPGVSRMPFVSYDPIVDSFVKAAYSHAWVLEDFDWPTWAQSAEARSLRDDETAIRNATPEQLARLLTVCIRQDRFVEGALMEAFDFGLILRIVERAAALVGAAPSTHRR
jgi:Family of unknown function (DUF6508)